MTVDVVHWNPLRKAPGLWNAMLRRKETVNNFGDLIGPVIVDAIATERKLDLASGRGRLLAVGSILRMARDGDTVWGAGINGKSLQAPLEADIDVRAVRGPLTAEWLRAQGIQAPEVYGDPGLLVPRLFAHDPAPTTSIDVLIVPNLNDQDAVTYQSETDGWVVRRPRTSLASMVRDIRSAAFVCGSSLHAIVLADAFGIPARLMQSEAEPAFKYEDYFEGTGRRMPHLAASVSEAVDLGPHEPLRWSPDALLAAFPDDLWGP